MKNAKSIGLQADISAQNAETPRNPNQSGAKIAGNEKNVNTSGQNATVSFRKNPNTSGCNC